MGVVTFRPSRKQALALVVALWLSLTLFRPAFVWMAEASNYVGCYLVFHRPVPNGGPGFDRYSCVW